MSSARLSILGLLRYDDTLLDNVHLPEAPFSEYCREDIVPPSKDVLLSAICRKCANLEIFYPNLITFRYAVENWFLENEYSFKKLWETCWFKYNPIWNKTFTTYEHEHYERQLKDEFGETESGDTKGNGKNSQSGTSGNQETETGRISSFNVNGYQDREQTVTNGNANFSNSGNYENGSDYRNKKDNTNDATGWTDTTRERDEKGNIGVTQTQLMLQAERDIAIFSWYDTVANMFKAEFCINVY